MAMFNSYFDITRGYEKWEDFFMIGWAFLTAGGSLFRHLVVVSENFHFWSNYGWVIWGTLPAMGLMSTLSNVGIAMS